MTLLNGPKLGAKGLVFIPSSWLMMGYGCPERAMTLDEDVVSTAILKRADGGELPAHSFPAAGGEPCILKGGLASAASTRRAVQTSRFPHRSYANCTFSCPLSRRSQTL